jgi:hypothetical protein
MAVEMFCSVPGQAAMQVEDAVAFLVGQRARQSGLFAPSQGQFVLAFLGTTNARGIAPALTVHPISHVTRTGDSACRIELVGDLAREPSRGESVTISLTDWPAYRGYQLKTQPVSGGRASIIEHLAPGKFALEASQVFTVHHTPNTVRVFETVPFEDLERTARAARRAVVGVGPMVNISPRFIICADVRDGVLSLFHGDGEANKTWMNLQQNALAAHIVHDHEDGRSVLFEGPCEQVARTDFPEIIDELCKHYVRIGYGLPSRIYRLVARRIAAA